MTSARRQLSYSLDNLMAVDLCLRQRAGNFDGPTHDNMQKHRSCAMFLIGPGISGALQACNQAPGCSTLVAVPSEKRSRTLETLTGTGHVYEGDRLISKVRFSLTVTRQMDGSGPAHLKDIRGVITILAGERHLAGGSTLVLRLADGSQWEFIAQSGNFISGEYVAIGTGRQNIITS